MKPFEKIAEAQDKLKDILKSFPTVWKDSAIDFKPII